MRCILKNKIEVQLIPIEYDKDGNEIPLPEQFDSEKENIIDVPDDILEQIGETKQYVDGEFIDYIPKEFYENQINEINEWFKLYDNQVLQYNRCQRLEIEYDEKYGSIEELDKLATENAKKLNELNKKINEEY